MTSPAKLVRNAAGAGRERGHGLAAPRCRGPASRPADWRASGATEEKYWPARLRRDAPREGHEMSAR
jgi:hypothetical protein